MRVCGVELSALTANVVVLDGNSGNFKVVDVGINKIELANSDSADVVYSFRDTFHAFIRDNNIEKIGIKKRNARGQYAGGGMTFKMEGIIQLAIDCEVILIPAQTISAQLRKASPPEPSNLPDSQRVAYDTAYTVLRISE